MIEPSGEDVPDCQWIPKIWALGPLPETLLTHMDLHSLLGLTFTSVGSGFVGPEVPLEPESGRFFTLRFRKVQDRSPLVFGLCRPNFCLRPFLVLGRGPAWDKWLTCFFDKNAAFLPGLGTVFIPADLEVTCPVQGVDL